MILHCVRHRLVVTNGELRRLAAGNALAFENPHTSLPRGQSGVLLVHCFQHSLHFRFSALACVPLIASSAIHVAFRHVPSLTESALCPISVLVVLMAFLVMPFASSPELSVTSTISSISLLPTFLVLVHQLTHLYGLDVTGPFAEKILGSVLKHLPLLPIWSLVLSIIGVLVELTLSLLEVATTRAEAMQMAGMARQVASRFPPELVARILKPVSEDEAQEEASEGGGVKRYQNYLSLADEVSHQSRTYETNSTGFIQMLLDTNLTRGQEELILNLQQSLAYSSRMNQCANLYFKADSGILVLDMSSSFDCQQIFDFTLSELAANLEHNANVNVVRRVDVDFPFLFGDSTYIVMIIKLLLENAAKYTMQGHITLSAHVLERSWSTTKAGTANEEFALVEFGVSDSGCGISAAQLPLLETPFSTQNDVFWSAQIPRGAGLGIPTASSLVHCFPEGRLDFESAENVGTSVRARFRLKIDASRTAEQEGLDVSSAPVPLPPSHSVSGPPAALIERRPCKIAVFAPEPIYTSLLGMLAPHGYVVKHILSRGPNSSDLAFEIRQAVAQRDAYNAVLVDVHAFGASPHHNERVFSLASLIKSNPVTTSTPIALMIHAGHFVGKTRQDGAIFDECILKPLLCQQVLATVRRMIAGFGDLSMLDPRFITAPLTEEEEVEMNEMHEGMATRAAASLAAHHAASGHSSSNSSPKPSSHTMAGAPRLMIGSGPDGLSSSFARFRRHSIDANLGSYIAFPFQSADSDGMPSTRSQGETETSSNGSSSHSQLGDLPESCESLESSPRTETSQSTEDSLPPLALERRGAGEGMRSHFSTPPRSSGLSASISPASAASVSPLGAALSGAPPPRLSRRSRTTVDSATVSAYHSWKDLQGLSSSGMVAKDSHAADSSFGTTGYHGGAGAGTGSSHNLAASASSTSPPTRLLVLIVEDDATNRLVLSKMVAHMGHESISADNGIDGLALFKQRCDQIDVVIMDYRMPKLDGVQTTTAIREFEAQTAREMPVTIVGLSADNSVRHRCLAAGMDSCWTKPLKAQTLQVVLLQRIMRGSNKSRISSSSSSSPLASDTPLHASSGSSTSLTSPSSALGTNRAGTTSTSTSQQSDQSPTFWNGPPPLSPRRSSQLALATHLMGSHPQPTPPNALRGGSGSSHVSGSPAAISGTPAHSTHDSANDNQINDTTKISTPSGVQQSKDSKPTAISPISPHPEYQRDSIVATTRYLSAHSLVSPGKASISASDQKGTLRSDSSPQLSSEATSTALSSSASQLQALAAAQAQVSILPPRKTSLRQLLPSAHRSTPSLPSVDSSAQPSTSYAHSASSQSSFKLPSNAISRKEGSSFDYAGASFPASSASLIAAPKKSSLSSQPAIAANRNRGANGEVLPLSRVSAASSASSASSTTAAAPISPHGERILLVEDNITVAKIAMTVLARNAQPAELATDGQEAFERISRDHSAFSVVLMDIHMPLVDGFECTALIRQFEQQYNLPPLFIIALTGEQLAFNPDIYLSTGFNHFLRKPVNYQMLIKQLPIFRAQRSQLSNSVIDMSLQTKNTIAEEEDEGRKVTEKMNDSVVFNRHHSNSTLSGSRSSLSMSSSHVLSNSRPLISLSSSSSSLSSSPVSQTPPLSTSSSSSSSSSSPPSVPSNSSTSLTQSSATPLMGKKQTPDSSTA